MKWLIIVVIIIIVIFFYARCKSSDTILQYIPKDNNKVGFTFKFQPDDSINQVISLIAQPVKKKSGLPMFLQIEFKGQRKNAEKLLSVILKLYAKNENTGIYEDGIIIKNTYAHYSFAPQDYTLYGFGEKNYTGDLNRIIHLPDEINKEDRINKVYIDNELMMDEYPKEVKAIIVVKWIGGEQEFSTFLTLQERKPGSKIRTNPFG